MIPYDTGKWGISFIFKIRGSVFPKTLTWAVPNALVAFMVKYAMVNYWGDYDGDTVLQRGDYTSSGFTALWSGYTFILGFLLVFRTQIAYSRFWEGCTALQQVKGSWVNAVSNLISFCSILPEKADEVNAFQHLLVRLMSLLFNAALQEIAPDLTDDLFETLGVDGIDTKDLDFLESCEEKSDVLLLWIQKLIVQNSYAGVIPIPPPILSRVFQELSNGIVDVQAARKISEFPFPFPYAQMISCFLILHYVLSPFLACFLVSDPLAAGTVTFVTVFAVWSINYIAAEIESPFGDDPNDIGVVEMQLMFNKGLKRLMAPESRMPPAFTYDPDVHPLFVFSMGRRRALHQSLDGKVENEGICYAHTWGAAAFVAQRETVIVTDGLGVSDTAPTVPAAASPAKWSRHRAPPSDKDTVDTPVNADRLGDIRHCMSVGQKGEDSTAFASHNSSNQPSREPTILEEDIPTFGAATFTVGGCGPPLASNVERQLFDDSLKASNGYTSNGGADHGGPNAASIRSVDAGIAHWPLGREITAEEVPPLPSGVDGQLTRQEAQWKEAPLPNRHPVSLVPECQKPNFIL